MSAAPHQHIVTALVQNEAGTINRLVSLFRRRGFSLASFNAGDCEEEGFSRLTLLVNGDDTEVGQCVRQLEKLIDVVECDDLGPEQSISRELALIRIDPSPEHRDAVISLAAEFMGKVVKDAPAYVVIEVSDTPTRIERLIEAVRPLGLTEVVRTGLVAIRIDENSK